MHRSELISKPVRPPRPPSHLSGPSNDAVRCRRASAGRRTPEAGCKTMKWTMERALRPTRRSTRRLSGVGGACEKHSGEIDTNTKRLVAFAAGTGPSRSWSRTRTSTTDALSAFQPPDHASKLPEPPLNRVRDGQGCMASRHLFFEAAQGRKSAPLRAQYVFRCCALLEPWPADPGWKCRRACILNCDNVSDAGALSVPPHQATVLYGKDATVSLLRLLG
ncbi:hypothetical protein C8Q73DRAFT_42837 [Cubamyces lactineus]|nr:hypothetical protein C8Q73DRAFT_42837 [Cubamyces lactineus]